MTIHHDWEDVGHRNATDLDSVSTPWSADGAFLAHQSYRRYGKRLLDVALVLLFSPLILTVISILALVVMTDGHQPFYRQNRVGRGGRIFGMWKLRSMVHGADEMLADHLDSCEDARAEWAHSQKLKSDPRVTRCGALLRKTSLDELPQLWNVLKGDMSLVGPRPMLPEQQVLYDGHAYRRLRPGITGPWQISDRNETHFAARGRFDDAYERRMSTGYDLSILIRTIGTVLRGTGY